MRNQMLAVAFSLSTAVLAEPLVFAPGNGVVTNVAGQIFGAYDSVEINTGTSGGGIVDFASPWSTYSGGATVNCGTLSLSGDLRPIGQPSVLGRGTAGEVVTVKDGTFHYAGAAAETDRGIRFAPSGAGKASVVSVAAGTSLKMTGPVTSEDGVLVKRGEGTFVLAPATSAATNVFCHATVNGSGELSFPANGDAPTAGYGELTVQEGRLVLDFPDGAVNVFHGGNVSSGSQALYVGRTPVGATTAKEAHLEIRGGDNYFSRTAYVGYKTGTATTTETVLRHSLDVYGGSFDNSLQEGCTIYVGVSDGADNRSVGEVNVHGGKVRTFYYRPGCHPGSVSRTFIANGALECYGVYAGQYNLGGNAFITDWDDPRADLIPEMEIHVSTNGILSLLGGPFYMCRDSLVRSTLRITDGGRMKFKGFTAAGNDASMAALQSTARLTVVLDGGTLDVSDQSLDTMASLPGVTTKLGARGGRMNANNAKAVYTFWGPIVSDDGVAEDGGIEFAGTGTYRLFCANSFTGAARVTGSCTLVLSNSLASAGVTLGKAGRLAAATAAVSIPSLVCPDMTATLCATYSGSAARRFDLAAFTPPSALLFFKLEGAFPVGDHELLTYPSSVVFDADRVAVEGGNVAGGRAYSFKTVVAGGTTKLVMTVKSATTPSATACSWANAAGGAWRAADNWSGAAPSAAAPAAVTFAAAPSADPVTVTLDDEQQVTSLSFPASPGYRIAGAGAIRLDNGGSPVSVAAAGGATNVVAVPVTTSGNLVFDVPPRGHVELASLAGSGAIATTVDSAGYGGVVKIGDASGFRGSISFQRGLLELGRMPDLLTALDVGFGEFRYAGNAAERLVCPVSFIATYYSNSKFCVADPAGEIHVDGSFAMKDGSFAKTGKGLLAFDGALDYSFAPHAAYYGQFDHTVKMTDAIGSPAWGFMWESSGRDRSQTTTFAGGTVRWGVPGQTVTFGQVGEGGLYVGGISTAEPGREFDAFAEINGGETVVNGRVHVGFRHGYPGTAEHSVLTSRVTMAAGRLRCNDGMFLLCDDRKVCSARAEWLQRGGDAEFATRLNLGYVGSANCSAFVEVSGGRLACGNGHAMLGGLDGNLASTTVRLTGGVLDIPHGGLYMCKGHNRLELLEGGTFRSQAIGATAAGDNRVLFDGGVWMACNPTGGCSLSCDLDEAALGAKGLVIDLTEMPAQVLTVTKALTVADGVAEDGGVVIRRRGGYRMGAVSFNDAQQTGFSGKLTIEAGGNARGCSNPCVTSNLAVTVKNGGAFGGQWTSAGDKYCCVKTLALGETAGDVAILQVQTGLPTYTGNFAGCVWATDSFGAPGTVDVTFTDNLGTSFLAPSYAMTVLIAPRGTIDASKFRYSALNPPASATFAVSSFDANYDKLTVTLADATSTEHTWTSAIGGAWGETANWNTAPADSIYDGILFPSAFAGGTIDLGGARTAMKVASASEGAVVLAGGSLDLATSAATVTTVSNGVLTLPAITAESEVAVNGVAPAGKVVLGGAKGATVIASRGGTVEGVAANFGTGDVKIDNATLSVVGDGMVNAKVVGKHGINLRTEGEVFFMKDVSAEDNSPFMKTGPGTAYLCGSGAVTLGNVNLGSNADDANAARTHVPSNGDVPADSLGGAITVVAGRLVLGVDGTQRVSTSGRFDVGTSYYELDGNGDVLSAEAEVLDGTLTNAGDLNIGRNPGRYAKENAALSGRRRDLAFTIRGGSARFNGFYMLHDNSGAFTGNTYLNVHGGELKFTGTYLNLGYHYRTGCTNFVNVCGGSLEFTTAKPNWANGILGAMVVLNLRGGEFKTVYPLSSQYNAANQYLVYNLAGGRLNVPYLRRVSTSGTENLVWDGGVYAPTANGSSIACQQRWTKHECRAGGAKIDLSGVMPDNPGDPVTFSMNQGLSHAEGLDAAEDGGIELLGGGTLTLDAANTMNGPVVVSGGVVKPTVAAAVSGGVVVNSNGVFDVNGLPVTATYLKGAGGTVAGGVLSVTGEIAPATCLTVSGLACGAGAVLKCPLTENEGAYTTTLLKVAENGAVTSAGRLAVDFCLEGDDVLPKGFEVKIAELGAGATFPAVTAVRTGHEPQHFWIGKKLKPGAGCTEVWVSLAVPSTAIILR